MLDVPTHGGQVSGPVCRHPVRKPQPLAGTGIPDVLVEQLCLLARLGEDDGANVFLHCPLKQPQGLLHDALADVVLLVHKLGVEQQQGAFPFRCTLGIHLLNRLACQLARKLAGVVDGGRCDNKRRMRAIEVRDAPQTSQQKCHVGTEDAMVVVCLVHDDEGEPAHEAGPALMVGQHAVVQRIRVGQQKAAELAQLRAGVLTCIAVVDCRVDATEAVVQCPHLGQLVFDECLCGIEKQCCRCRVLEQIVQHRQ